MHNSLICAVLTLFAVTWPVGASSDLEVETSYDYGSISYSYVNDPFTEFPTEDPTEEPTFSPTTRPSPVPSVDPTFIPPTKVPTVFPSAKPSSRAPTTLAPTPLPGDPTASPVPPTVRPTASPTSRPSRNPTAAPSVKPTAHPTDAPTRTPTAQPSIRPTRTPTDSPTTGPPSSRPTQAPTPEPGDPTMAPVPPTLRPTNAPSARPSFRPTNVPTSKPSSATPTSEPSSSPTASPTSSPTLATFFVAQFEGNVAVDGLPDGCCDNSTCVSQWAVSIGVAAGVNPRFVEVTNCNEIIFGARRHLVDRQLIGFYRTTVDFRITIIETQNVSNTTKFIASVQSVKDNLVQSVTENSFSEVLVNQLANIAFVAPSINVTSQPIQTTEVSVEVAFSKPPTTQPTFSPSQGSSSGSSSGLSTGGLIAICIIIPLCCCIVTIGVLWQVRDKIKADNMTESEKEWRDHNVADPQNSDNIWLDVVATNDEKVVDLDEATKKGDHYEFEQFPSTGERALVALPSDGDIGVGGDIIPTDNVMTL